MRIHLLPATFQLQVLAKLAISVISVVPLSSKTAAVTIARLQAPPCLLHALLLDA